MADQKKDATRKYRLKKRADSMAETRQRIAEAAAELHGTIGPARTSLSAVAKLAGVQRHTVYRHFPTEVELFGACSAHFFTENPLPDLEGWRKINDPRERLQQALAVLYGYYGRTEGMFSNVLRDAELVEDLRPALVPMQEYLGQAVEILSQGWASDDGREHLVTAALRHAVDFMTWRSLMADDLISQAEAVDLIVGLVAIAAGAAG